MTAVGFFGIAAKNPRFLASQQEEAPYVVSNQDSLTSAGAGGGGGGGGVPSKAASFVNNDTANSSMVNGEDPITSSTRDTVVVLVTLSIIFITLIATYFLWRKHRSSLVASHCKLEEYRYSRLSQNDVEVDNISFQGDLTHKALINSVPVCAEEEGEDDNVKPATLCLDYDSLITISNDDNSGNQRKSTPRRSSISDDNAPVNLLIDELSDEDLLQ